MKRRFQLLMMVFSVLALSSCAFDPPRPVAQPIPAAPTPAGDPVEGLRLATIVGCNGCHTKTGEGKVFHEEPGYRGVAPNLTVRRELYTDAGISDLLRRGQTRDGHRPIGMPIQGYQHLTDQNVQDIIAWLRWLPPVPSPDVPATMVSEQLKPSLLAGTYPLPEAAVDSSQVHDAAQDSRKIALGRRLAYVACAECHGGDLVHPSLSIAPPLVVAKIYDTAQFSRLMLTGTTAAGTESTTGLMSKVARARFSVLTQDEVQALKLYLDGR
ncbi:hypothetical protein BH11PSE14_BH11PSE14_01780 [soil metagenome]